MGKRWSLSIAYDEKELPRRLDGSMESDGTPMRMVLLVKGRRPAGTLTDASMNLDVPDSFAVYSLDQ